MRRRFEVNISKCLMNFDFDLLGFGFLYLGQSNRQHAILERSVDLGCVNSIRELETATEFAETALADIEVTVFSLGGTLLAAGKGEDVILQFDLNVVTIDPR